MNVRVISVGRQLPFEFVYDCQLLRFSQLFRKVERLANSHLSWEGNLTQHEIGEKHHQSDAVHAVCKATMPRQRAREVLGVVGTLEPRKEEAEEGRDKRGKRGKDAGDQLGLGDRDGAEEGNLVRLSDV